MKICVTSSNVTKQMLYTCQHCGAWDWLSRIIQKTHDEEKKCKRCNKVLALEVYKLENMEKIQYENMEEVQYKKESPERKMKRHSSSPSSEH